MDAQGHIALYNPGRNLSPQCNRDRRITELLLKNVPGAVEVRCFPAIYWMPPR